MSLHALDFEGTIELLGPAGRIVVVGRGDRLTVHAGWRLLLWAVRSEHYRSAALRAVPVRTDILIRAYWIATALPRGGKLHFVLFPKLFGYRRGE